MIPSEGTRYLLRRSLEHCYGLRMLRCCVHDCNFRSAQEALDFLSSVFHENQLDARSKFALLEMLES
ncbi:hypothetical protein [Acidithrix ferrooxidans]|uniref:hypothetical protein n=1 Tax=Acidithrix ferrooxidans TaxID=1280514 RepID=UPI00126A2CC7|nr:hypothetical protein [Acidithrix ferrooxidans]